MNTCGHWTFELQDQVDPTMLPSSVYASAAYLELFAANEEKDLRYVVGHSPMRGPIVLPIGMTQIGDGVFEACSVYGYGGIMTRDPDHAPFGDGFCRELRQFLARCGIASIFLRHSPFLANAELLPDDWKELNRKTYVVNLNPHDDLDAFCSKADQKLRWSVRYALRNGLRCGFSSHPGWNGVELSGFYSIYRELMLKKETNPFYLFSREFFKRHGESFGGDCELAIVVGGPDDEVLAGAFFLKDLSGYVHYHLSASSEGAMKLQAMELLMGSAIVRYGRQGLHTMHLGGGHSVDGSDGLSRFKKKFATTEKEFHISRIVCDKDAYERERARLPLAKPTFFNISEAR